MESLAQQIAALVAEATGYRIDTIDLPDGGVQARWLDPSEGGLGRTHAATLPCPSEDTAVVALLQEVVQHRRDLLRDDTMQALVGGYARLLSGPASGAPRAREKSKARRLGPRASRPLRPTGAGEQRSERPAVPGQCTSPAGAPGGLDAILAALGLDPLRGSTQIVDARQVADLPADAPGEDLRGRWLGPSARLLNAQLPLVVSLLSAPSALARVVAWLAARYPATHPITLARLDGAAVTALPLGELASLADDARYDALYAPPLDPLDDLRSPNTLGYITARLRGPGGCPWDREQTPTSLTPYMLEEAHEAVDAIERADLADTVEELGDVLLQVVLHSQLAEEEGRFSLADVAAEVNAKLVRRHPHVFGDVQVGGSSDVLRNWEVIKRAEKGEKRASVLDGVPPALPALLRAQTIGRKAAKVGFDWPDIQGTLDKAREELDEIARAVGADERREELGDLLFALTSVCRHLEIDAEQALREATAKFERRFRRLEADARARGLDLTAMGIDELESLWQEAKTQA